MQIYYCMRRKEKRTFTVYRLSYWLLVLFMCVYVYVWLNWTQVYETDCVRKKVKEDVDDCNNARYHDNAEEREGNQRRHSPSGQCGRCSHKERMRAIEALEREHASAESIRGARAVRWKRRTNAVDVLRWNTQARSSCLPLRALWPGERAGRM